MITLLTFHNSLLWHKEVNCKPHDNHKVQSLKDISEKSRALQHASPSAVDRAWRSGCNWILGRQGNKAACHPAGRLGSGIHGMTVCGSRDHWGRMLQGEEELFLWNFHLPGHFFSMKMGDFRPGSLGQTNTPAHVEDLVSTDHHSPETHES